MVGIIGAMPIEVEMIQALLQESEVVTLGRVKFHKGKLCGKDAVVAVCGVGKVNAALCAQAMLLSYQPSLILNVGVGGGLLPNMRIGDIAVATSVVQHDMDTTSLGEPRGYISNLQCVNINCDPEAVRTLFKAAQGLNDVQAHLGVIASGDQFISVQATKDTLARGFDAIACEMEGAAIGQACALYGVPFAVLRAISDGAGEGAALDFMTFARQAAERSATLLCDVFANGLSA